MIKRIAIAFAIVVALLLTALVLITLLFNPNDYKDKIASLAREATGRELAIIDDMKLSLFPWIGVEFGRVEFANAAGFGPQPFARIAAAKVKVRLLPLLQRRIEVDTVILNGLEVSLETAADGRTNWDDLAARGAKEDGAGTEPAPPPEETAALALPAALTIGGLDVRDGALHWRDAVAGIRLDIGALRLASDRIEAGKPVDLQLAFDLRGTQPPVAGRLELSTRLTADLAQQRLRAENLRLHTALAGEDMPVGALELKLQADAVADLAGEVYRLEKLRLGAEVSGEQLPGGRLNLDLQGSASADLGKQTAELPDFVLSAQGVTLRGTLHATRLLEAPLAAGHLEADAFNPRELLQALGQPAPQTADASALRQAAFAFDFEAASDRATVTALKMQLDDSTLTGAAAVRDFAAPALAFDLALDRIDLDRYLPPSQDEPAAATPAAAAPAALQLPLDTLRALDLDGRLSAGQLRVSGLSLADLRAQVRARDGLIALAPLSANLYGGRYAGNIRLDARGAVPVFSLKESLSGIQAAPLLKDLLDNETFSGTADFALEATASGDTETALLRSLHGTARFSLRDGAVKGFNTAQMIREAKAKLEGRPPPPAATNQTDLSELGGTLRFDSGIARNDDLHASSPYLRIGGKGQADLIRQELDYRLRVKLVGTEIGQGGEQAGNLKGVEIPIRISGAFAAPSVALDSAVIRDVVKQKAKAAVKEAVDANRGKIEEKAEQKQQELKRKVEEQVKDKLKDLLR
jgi:AsmA protein